MLASNGSSPRLSPGGQNGWADLVEQSQVSRATAQRDIADLKARGLIEFVGAGKRASIARKVKVTLCCRRRSSFVYSPSLKQRS